MSIPVPARRALPWTHGGITLLTLTGVWTVGLALRPPAVSDFHAHWVSAADLALYLKGGVAILAYVPLARLGWSTSVAACVINSLAWILLSRSFWLGRGAPVPAQALATLALAPLGVWWVIMGGLVNTDLPHLGLALFGLHHLLLHWDDERPRGPVLSALLIGAGVSVRLQALPCLLLVLGLCCAAWLRARVRGTGRSRRVARGCLVLAGAACLGGSTDWALRQISTVPRSTLEAITIRSPLYNGLLASPLGPGCGSWRPESNALIGAEIDEGLWRVISRHVGEHGWSHWARLMKCKLRSLIGFRQLGWPYLVMSVSSRQEPGGTDPLRILAASDTVATCLSKVLLLVLLAPRIGLRLGRSNHLWLSAWAVASSYLALHMLLEIQPRYLLPVLTFPAWLAIQGLARPSWRSRSSSGVRLSHSPRGGRKRHFVAHPPVVHSSPNGR